MPNKRFLGWGDVSRRLVAAAGGVAFDEGFGHSLKFAI